MATCSVAGIDADAPLLLDALEGVGIEAVEWAWDDPTVDWGEADLTVIRSTWDYPSRRHEFLAWARSLTAVANPVPALEWSSDKAYLLELAEAGVPVIETAHYAPGQPPTLPEGDFVVKPAVGAGSVDAARYGAHQRDEAYAHVARLHLEDRSALVQPYVASVDVVGERALIFIDGAFSHAMTKSAMLNAPETDRTRLFRAEAMSRAEAEPEARALAESILEGLGFEDLLYARVDLVATERGFAVMEVELVEPSLFLTHHPPAARALAQAVARRLGA